MSLLVLPVVDDALEERDELEEELLEFFRQEFFYPLLREIGFEKAILTNALEDVISAIGKNRIRFNRGEFTGNFTAQISRELKALGAKWSRTNSSWKINLADLPSGVRVAIMLSQEKFARAASKLDRKLEGIVPEHLASKLSVTNIFDRTLWKVGKSVKRSVEKVSVAPELTDERRLAIAEEYTKNLKLTIVDFSKKEILALRKKVQQHTFEGNRYEELVESIQHSWQVSRSKARFLARQETNVLLSKFKSACYTENGVNLYKWRCVVGSPKHPVRPRHRELNDESNRGKLFRFDDPPMMSDGTKKNPGEDYNCRCTARAVVRF